MGTGGEHWLWRLSARDWLAAAENELKQGRSNLGARRTAVTFARRAAGMALNGALVAQADRGWASSRCETAWGRSYMDHLRTLADAADGSVEAREPFAEDDCLRCRELLAIPMMPPQGLVQLSAGRDQAASRALELAELIVHACAARIQP